MADLTKPKKQVSVWWFAFGYFAVYIPYSIFTKITSSGLLAKDLPQDQIASCLCKRDLPKLDSALQSCLNANNGVADACASAQQKLDQCTPLVDACKPESLQRILDVTVPGAEWLPPTIMASILMMLVFITSMRWWKYATQTKFKVAGHTLPRPRIWTLFSGICTGFVVATTTLAYTIDGVSIVFAMLLMRGGMLVMSPIVDTIFKRHVRWFSWAALGLSLLALIVSNFGPYAFHLKVWGAQPFMNTILAIDLIVYLSAYFFRLTFMSKLAKSDNADDTKKFFVEEQMVGTPSILLILFIVSLFYAQFDPASDLGRFVTGIHNGFTSFWSRPGSILALAFAAGLFSQFNGVFGSLILLDKSENAFAVAVNRCSSILAGVIASLFVAIVYEADLSGKSLMPDAFTWISAAMVVGALLFLALPKMFATLEKQKKAAANTDTKAEEKAEEPKAEDPKDEAKAEAPKDEAKAEEPKAEEKSEEPKAEEKAEEK